MGVVPLLVLILGFGFIAFLAFYGEYKRFIKKYKPDYFGRDLFHQVTYWQTSEWQDLASRKGITMAEWQSLCDQQLIWVETAIEGHVAMKGMV